MSRLVGRRNNTSSSARSSISQTKQPLSPISSPTLRNVREEDKKKPSCVDEENAIETVKAAPGAVAVFPSSSRGGNTTSVIDETQRSYNINGELPTIMVAQIVLEEEEDNEEGGTKKVSKVLLDEDEREKIQQQAKVDVEMRIPKAVSISSSSFSSLSTSEKGNDYFFGGRRMYLLITVLFLLLLAIVSVILPITVLSKNDDDDDDYGDDDDNTTDSPAPLFPTTSPTTTPPTFQNYGSDDCDASKIIEWPTIGDDDENAAVETSILYFSGSNVETDRELYRESCTGASNGHGVWYSMKGHGKRTMAKTVQGTTFDTQLSVYKGNTDDCQYLQCLASNIDFGDEDSDDDLSLVTWFAEEDTYYHIMVHGYRNDAGNFTLSLETLPDHDTCDSAHTLSEALESTTISMKEFGSTIQGKSTESNTFAEELPPCYGSSGTEQTSHIGASGVWYKFAIDATIIEDDSFLPNLHASIDTSSTDFDDGTLTIFATDDDDCTNLQCIGSVGTGSRLSFLVTDPSQTYYIFVHNKGTGSSGEFFLELTSMILPSNFDPPSDASNLICEDAKPIDTVFIPTLKEETFHSDHDASQPIEERTCGDLVFFTAPDKWYSVVGTGRPMQVTTCGTGTHFDTQLSVFRGTCTDLICVDGNDQSLSCTDNVDSSTVSWYSTANETYYIAVHGAGSQVGNFELTILELPEDTGDMMSSCETAIGPILADGSAILGSNKEFPRPANNDEEILSCILPAVDDDVDIYSTWYEFVGTGSTVTASTCDSPNEANIVIVTGDCDNTRTCSDIVEVTTTPCGSANEKVSVTWKAEQDVTYHLLIYQTATPSPSITGDPWSSNFLFRIEETVYNDSCDTAIGLLTPNGVPTRGSIRSSTGITHDVDIFPSSCTSNSTSSSSLSSVLMGTDNNSVAAGRGIYYKVMGNGNVMTASTCSEYTDFNNQIYIFYDGEETEEFGTCTSLSCVPQYHHDGGSTATATAAETTATTTSCPFGTTVSWLAEEGKLYSILVAGIDNDDIGSFQLQISTN